MLAQKLYNLKMVDMLSSSGEYNRKFSITKNQWGTNDRWLVHDLDCLTFRRFFTYLVISAVSNEKIYLVVLPDVLKPRMAI